MRVNFHRPIEGKKIHDFIEDKERKVFFSFVCEVKDPKPEYHGSEIGIDVGLKTFAVPSNGKSFEKPQYLKKAEARLAYWQRIIARR